MCVFITAVPITKLFARGGGEWRTCATRGYEPRGDVCVCVFITAVPVTKLFARGGGGMEDMCYERLRAKAYVN
jgi:hypothetical protein